MNQRPEPRAADLGEAIRLIELANRPELFAVDAELVLAVPELVDERLYSAEREHIARAVPKRRAEFGTARLCARTALRRLGWGPQPFVPQSDGAPRWPSGIVGSISHTRGCCAAVVARAADAAGIGIDVELDVELPRELFEMVCTDSEQRWLEHHSPGERGRLARLLFSAKEAFYKCQYTLTRDLLDFRDVELRVDLATHRFAVVDMNVGRARRHELARVEGRWLRDLGLIVAGATLRHDSRQQEEN